MALIGNKATNDPITAAWANSLRDQTVQVTLSSARPSSPAEGMVIYETDTDRLMAYDGTTWRAVSYVGASDSWSPTVTQGSTRSGTTQYSNVQTQGRWAHAALIWQCTTTGSVTNIFLSAPTPSPPNPGSSNDFVCGHGHFYDGATREACTVVTTTSGLQLFDDRSGGTGLTIALASGSKIVLALSYPF